MAQGSDTKLYVALGLLTALGGGYYLQQKGTAKQTALHSAASTATKLPSLSLTAEQSGTITKIVLSRPATEGEGAQPAAEITLVKTGDNWMLDQPVKALANQKNVESLLENLTKLEVKEQVAQAKDSYPKYEVSDEKAQVSTFYAGDKVVRAIWAGKSGGRGQMARLDGSDGVFIVDGYSGFLYSRDAKGWRDLSILELDPEEAREVTVTNENGEFAFVKEGTDWKGKFKKAKTGAGVAIKEFESKKVTDLLNAYKKLTAAGFGDGMTMAAAGLETPSATLKVVLGDSKSVVVEFGAAAEGSSRWARVPGKEEIFSLSSWASDWAFADEKKFQKSDEPEPADGPPGGGFPGGLPPGMQMPGGHP